MTSANRSKRFTLITATLVALVAVLALARARALAADDDKVKDDDKDWKVLGNAKLEKKGGAAEIKVGADQGLIKRIKFEVRGTDVEFKKVTVTYEKGDPEEVELRDTVKRGEKTRAIDLEGGNRVIKKVVLAFKLDKDVDRDARIILMGHK